MNWRGGLVSVHPGALVAMWLLEFGQQLGMSISLGDLQMQAPTTCGSQVLMSQGD